MNLLGYKSRLFKFGYHRRKPFPGCAGLLAWLRRGLLNCC